MTKNAKVLVCKMAFECDRRWQELNPVAGVPAVRYCNHCDEAVYFCDSMEQVERHRQMRHCIAIPSSDIRREITLGMPPPPPPPQAD